MLQRPSFPTNDFVLHVLNQYFHLACVSLLPLPPIFPDIKLCQHMYTDEGANVPCRLLGVVEMAPTMTMHTA